MKTLVFRTDAPRTVEMTVKRIHWVESFSMWYGPPQSYQPQFKTVIISTRPLADMLTEIDDGVAETDAREAIQAAALAGDWTLAQEIAARYSWMVCLRCASDVSQRPTWRLHKLGVPNSWSEICGSCAYIMLLEATK